MHPFLVHHQTDEDFQFWYGKGGLCFFGVEVGAGGRVGASMANLYHDMRWKG